MQSFRYFVAVGVGAAIALSLIEPSASKDVPSLTKNGEEASCLGNTPLRDRAGEELPIAVWFKVHCSLATATKPGGSANRAENRDSQPVVAPNPQGLTAAPKTPQKTEANRSDSASATNESVIVPSISSNSEPPKPTELPAKADTLSKPASPTDSAPVAKVADANSPTLSDRVSQSAQENLSLPIQPTSGASISQSPAPATPRLSQQQPEILAPNAQPPQKPPETPAPEYLNPSANPLLFPTQAEEVQIKTSQPITLQQAIELGRRNNRDIQTARLTLERTQAALEEALAAEFPTATVGANFNRTEATNQNSLNDPLNPNLNNTNRVSTSFNGLLQLTYALYTAGRRPATIRAAEQQVRFQELEVERLSQQLRLNVTLAYYTLQQADAQVDISRAAVANATQSLRDALLQEQAGLGTRFDVLQAQVSLANANQDLTRALSQQRISRRQIVQLLSLAQPVDVSAADPIEEAGIWNLSLEQSIVLAFKNRAELEQQLLQRDISEQQRRIALSAIRPQASLSASYNVVGV
jgi:OMF family outer membrane factor